MLRGEDVWLCMCARVRVGFDKLLLLSLLLLRHGSLISPTIISKTRRFVLDCPDHHQVTVRSEAQY